LIALLLALASSAAAVDLNGRIEQGGLAIGVAVPGSTVVLDGRAIEVAPDGEFVFGFDRDAPAKMALTVTPPNGPAETHMLDVARRDWKIETVAGLPQRLVTPDPATEALIAADNKLMRAARSRTEPEPFYRTGFIRPAEGRISGVFGSQRVLNGVPRAPHVGLDIAGPVGTPVRAAADGIVSIANPKMVLTGKTVVIEHGYGLDTVYIHMSAIAVRDGQRVSQGDVIGAIGQSGRANGPHLHFGVTWFETRLDPETVLAVLPPGLAAPLNSGQ
jgi:murein DD-endopeptidase MepM/ murein hydrolase activator NlpD